jgi:hypothetical protein
MFTCGTTPFISWSNITNVELVYTLGRVPCRNKSSNKAQQANSFKRRALSYPAPQHTHTHTQTHARAHFVPPLRRNL